MDVDPVVQRSLDSFGFAQVLVAIGEDDTSPDVAGEAALGRHFMSDMPDAFGGTSLAAGGASAQREGPAVRFFPRLGVALGYVDRGGIEALAAETNVGQVAHADYLSLVRPVRVSAARRKTKATWGLRRLNVAELWRQGLTGKGVRVGHLDTGVDGSHSALQGRIAAFAEFDFNGYQVPGAGPHDSGDHGTHTAGTICGGQVGGMAIGVAPEAELCSGLVIEGGNTLLRVLSGMEWALEQQVRVLNMSLGFRGYTPFLLRVTQRLRRAGVLPVFAIGNEGPGTSRSPGNYAEALSVGATDRADRLAWFSSSITFQRSTEPNQPNVVAPGVDVISLKPGGGLRSMDGTSMATPHVAGLAALLFQSKPTATVEEVEQAIQATCIALPNEAQRAGFGLVHPRGAVQALS